MSVLVVERIGGLAGFGGQGAHIRSRGQIAFSSLSPVEQRVIETLFAARRRKKTTAPDVFRYRISRETGKTIEVTEEEIPAAVAACVKDELV